MILPVMTYALIVCSVVFGVVYFGMMLWCVVQRPKRVEVVTQKVAVIIPCRGAGDDFKSFLLSLGRQSLPNLEYVFSFTNKNDPGIQLLRDVADYPYTLCVASKYKNQADKIRNIWSALDKVSSDAQYVVFLDADGELPDDYLAYLVAPLMQNPDSITSTYRLYDYKHIGGLVVKYWNLISTTWKAFPLTRFVWSGGYGLSRKTLDRLDIKRLWHNVLSDDMTLNSVVHPSKVVSIPVYAHSSNNHTFLSGMHWVIRQTYMAYIYYPKMHWSAFSIMVVHICLIILAVFTGNIGYAIAVIGFCVGVFLLVLRFGSWKEIVLFPFIVVVTSIAFIYPLIRVLGVRYVDWGGIRYYLDKKGLIYKQHPVTH